MGNILVPIASPVYVLIDCPGECKAIEGEDELLFILTLLFIIVLQAITKKHSNGLKWIVGWERGAGAWGIIALDGCVGVTVGRFRRKVCVYVKNEGLRTRVEIPG